jgi:hypothetical protein
LFKFQKQCINMCMWCIIIIYRIFFDAQEHVYNISHRYSIQLNTQNCNQDPFLKT